MTTTPDKPIALDAFGLPKITLGGKLEEDNRDHSRAPITSGGTITGKSFQTSNVDPRIVIDSDALSAHRLDGTETIRIDVNTGLVSINAGSSSAPGIQFVTTPGNAVIARIYDDTGAIYNAAALTEESAGDIDIIAVPAIGAGNGGQLAELVLFSGTGAGTFQAINAAQTEVSGVLLTTGNPSRVSLQTLHGGALEAVDVVDGNLIFQTGSKYTGTIAGQTVMVGMKGKAVTAGDGFALAVAYRHVRTDSAGTPVTPGSVTLGGAPFANVNSGVPTVASIASYGGQFVLNAAAAGLFNYLNSAVVN